MVWNCSSFLFDSGLVCYTTSTVKLLTVTLTSTCYAGYRRVHHIKTVDILASKTSHFNSRIGKNCWHSGAAKHIKIFCLPRYSSLNKSGAVVRALTSHKCGPRPNPGLDVVHVCGLSLLLVLSLAPRGFSPDTPVFCFSVLFVLLYCLSALTPALTFKLQLLV